MEIKYKPELYLRNNGYYSIKYWENRERKFQATGKKSLFEATKVFEGWLEERRVYNLNKNDPFISDCLDQHYKQWIRERMLSWNRYPSIIKNLKSFFGNLRVSEIQMHHSEQYIRERFAGKHSHRGIKGSPSTVRKELQNLRASLNFMVERIEPRHLRLSREQLPYIELCDPSPSRDKVFSYEELESMRNFCFNDSLPVKTSWNRIKEQQSNRIPRINRALLLLIETAQRKTAITELKWDQVRFDLGKYGLINFLPHGRKQTSKRRPPVPISEILSKMLKRSYDERINDYVLDKTSDIWFEITSVGHYLNIPGVTPHVFRHTYCTHKIQEGYAIEKVARFIGDEVETVRKNYEHLSPNYLSDMV